MDNVQKIPILRDKNVSNQVDLILKGYITPGPIISNNLEAIQRLGRLMQTENHENNSIEALIENKIGISISDLELALRDKDEVILSKVLFYIVTMTNLLEAPTVLEMNVEFIRKWSSFESSLRLNHKEIKCKSYHPVILSVNRPSNYIHNMKQSSTNKIHNQSIFLSNNPFYNYFINQFTIALQYIFYFLSYFWENGQFKSLVSMHENILVQQIRTSKPSVQSFAWHHYQQYLAVSFYNDTIQIYNVQDECWTDSIGVLQHEFQRSISYLEWQPFSKYGLAVACLNGICFWIDGLKWMTFLKSSEKVTSLSWSANGKLLAAGNIDSPNITIWDVGTKQNIVLYKMKGSINSLLWSPNSFYLYSENKFGFRIWETQTWSCELYTDFKYPVQAACWSKDGRTMLLACGQADNEKCDKQETKKREKLTLYALKLIHNPPIISGKLVPMTLDLSNKVASQAALHIFDVSKIRQIAWNDTCERFAVCFEDAPGIAIYSVTTECNLHFFFIGHVWGPPGMLPKYIAFQPKFKHGALLTVIYEDKHQLECTQTHIRFIPMYYS